jgi:hypothetical protein
MPTSATTVARSTNFTAANAPAVIDADQLRSTADRGVDAAAVPTAAMLTVMAIATTVVPIRFFIVPALFVCNR